MSNDLVFKGPSNRVVDEETLAIAGKSVIPKKDYAKRISIKGGLTDWLTD